MTIHEESFGPFVKGMKLRSAFMVCFMALWLLSVMASVVHAQDFNYTTNNGEITITKYIGPWGAVLVIPETIDGLPVTRIGESTFASGELMQDFHSPSSVKIPNSVISIGEGAFEYRQGLTNITIPTSITNLPARLCHGCRHLTTITIPNSVTSIGDQAFESCAYLDNPNIPDSVRHVGSRAFAYCDSLRTIDIPNSVTMFGDSVFAYCTNLNKVTLSDKLSNLPAGLFQGCSNLVNITIPNSVSSIGQEAFLTCVNLSKIIFLGNTPTMGDCAFGEINAAIIYYMPGTKGWESTFGGLPTLPWTLSMKNGGINPQTNSFDFRITGLKELVVIIEACTNLANPVWVPLQTNTLAEDTSYFTDPKLTNTPSRFYRLRAQ